ncbi:MAG: flagellar basal body P-ring formation protein FlgA [Calditrichaeota bacterium]|nr:flagellar basal body P-ring formation protein FlgA [Calditrichota bacterium]
MGLGRLEKIKYYLSTVLFVCSFSVFVPGSISFAKISSKGSNYSQQQVALIKMALHQFVKDRAKDEGKIEIALVSVPENFPPGVKPPITVSCRRRGEILGRTVFMISLTKGNGLQSSFPVVANVRRFHKVFVLNSNVSRRHILTEKDIRPETLEVTWSRSEKPADNSFIIGKRAKRRLEKGRMITRSMLEDVPVVERGEPTNMQIRSKNLNITMPVVACQDGIIGEEIKVRNKSNGAYYIAQVQDAQTVIFKYNKRLK